MVCDPLFEDINKGDFRLKKGSPAYKIGFKDIDQKSIGLTDEFPAKFFQIVKNQLGNDYDNFDLLEKLCKPMTGATSNEFKEIPGI